MTLHNLTRQKSTRSELLPVEIFFEDDVTPPVAASVQIAITRESDGLKFDFDDDVFKLSPTTEYGDLAESSITDGLFELAVDHSTLVEADRLLVRAFGLDGVTQVGAFFTVEVVEVTDASPFLSVFHDTTADKFKFSVTLRRNDVLITSTDAEPVLTIFAPNGDELDVEASDFSDLIDSTPTGVFRAELAASQFYKGNWNALLVFEAYGTTFSINPAFNVL